MQLLFYLANTKAKAKNKLDSKVVENDQHKQQRQETKILEYRFKKSKNLINFTKLVLNFTNYATILSLYIHLYVLPPSHNFCHNLTFSLLARHTEKSKILHIHAKLKGTQIVRKRTC